MTFCSQGAISFGIVPLHGFVDESGRLGAIVLVYSVSFTPDSKTLASSSEDKVVIWGNLDFDDLLVIPLQLDASLFAE
jgi:hypothetical protein